MLIVNQNVISELALEYTKYHRIAISMVKQAERSKERGAIGSYNRIKNRAQMYNEKCNRILRAANELGEDAMDFLDIVSAMTDTEFEKKLKAAQRAYAEVAERLKAPVLKTGDE